MWAAVVSLAVALLAQSPPSARNPSVMKIVEAVSEERIAASMKKLESFGTRYILSEDSPGRGIAAAQRWLFDEFKSYSPRLEVAYDTFTLKKGPRIPRDVELANVVAVLPGTINKDRYIVVGGHYDSIALRRRAPGARAPEEGAAPPPEEGSAPPAGEVEPLAPGVADNASGTAAVLELARVMSAFEFDKTLVFIAFSAEEVGLHGAASYAKKAKEQKLAIEAMLNNDIIGSDVAGNGRSANGRVRLFAEGPEDSPARSLARYVKEVGERYVPSMTVDLVFRRDRFGRGGDHTAFTREGFGAVRFTTASENYAHQHSATDTFANASVPYTARVTRMNAAVAASLALAPRTPVTRREPGAAPPAAQGQQRQRGMLNRGRSGYDAALQWLYPAPEADLAGFAVVIRPTTSALWEREIFVGNVTQFTIPDLSIDDVVIGVKAIDKDGNQSLAATYEQGPFTIRGAPGAQPAKPAPAAATGNH